MNYRILVFVLSAVAAAALAEEQPKLDLTSFEQRADERVSITLDKDLLGLAARFLPQDDEDTGKVRALIKNLDSIWVRTFKFEHDQGYSTNDLENLRKKLGADWSRMVEVRGKDNVDFFVKKSGDKIQGFTIITAEPRELTVISIQGSLRPEQLSELEGFAGIPRGLWKPKEKQETEKPRNR